jgi:hypothetical protein
VNCWSTVRRKIFLNSKENNMLISIYPLASFFGNNVTLRFNFDSNTLRRNISIDSTVYCQSNNSRWIANITSSSELSCVVPFNDHVSSYLNLSIVLDVPSLSSVPIVLSKNVKSHFYLKSSLIQFATNNETQFEYTKTTLKVQISSQTFIPSYLFPNIKCRLSDSTGYAMVTNFTSINESNPSFNCYFNTPNAGTKNISLWYSESNQEFEISSNLLEIVFVGNLLQSQYFRTCNNLFIHSIGCKTKQNNFIFSFNFIC